MNAAAKDAELYLRRCRKLEDVIADLLAALENAHGILQVNLGDTDPHVRSACDLMWTAIVSAKAAL